MPGTTVSFSSPPAELLQLLGSHLPWSLTILRRLQFCSFERGKTEHTRIVLSSDVGGLGEDASARPSAFTVSYVDVSGGPDTQMWLYSTLEDQDGAATGVDEDEYEQQLLNVVQEIIRLRQEYGKELRYPSHLLLGAVHSKVRAILERTGRVSPRITGSYDKWIFPLQDLPPEDTSLPEGMIWDKATMEDCHFVVSRTEIPRQAAVLFRLPNFVVKLEDKTPVAWAFLCPDASLASLTCEEPYRRKGIAKKLTARLFRELNGLYGDDGFGSADVSPDNQGSRAMCRSLGGRPSWVVSWVLLNVADTVGSEPSVEA